MERECRLHSLSHNGVICIPVMKCIRALQPIPARDFRGCLFRLREAVRLRNGIGRQGLENIRESEGNPTP